jgi:large subunit ribosomal protein L13
MKTTTFPKGLPQRDWHLIDGTDAVMGRLASQVARILMGKHKPTYTPFLDTGDHVVVINASKIKFTGNKLQQKVYRSHSGYPGGLVEVGATKMKATRPDRMFLLAVEGMLPKTKLGKHMLTKLRVYPGPTHKQQAQKPVELAAASR